MKRLSGFLVWAALFVVLALGMQTAQARHLGTSTVGAGFTYQVPSGCAQPANAATGTTYYVKPSGSGGSDAANGLTLGTAWATPAHAEATMAAGDQALVQSGTYGPITWNRSLANFAWIKADAGQTVIITGYNNFNGASKWVTEGLIFQDTFTAVHFSSDPLIEVNGTTSQLVFNSDTFRSAPVATYQAWNAGQWASLVRGSGLEIDGATAVSPSVTCVAVTNSSFNGLAVGTDVGLDSVLIKGNSFFWYDGDGIDWAGNNVEISYNDIRNSLNPSGGSSAHPDAIQAQPGRCPGTVAATFTGSTSGTTLTVSSISGTIGLNASVGDGLTGSGVTTDTKIVSYISGGTPGGNGTYQISKSQTLGSRAMSDVLSCNYSNAVINANVVIELDTSSGSVPFTSYDSSGGGAPEQGISWFNMDWTNQTVTNNIVMNSSTWGIGISSCHTCTISNNVGYVDNVSGGEGIYLSKYSHEGAPSDHVTMTNNITNRGGDNYFDATNNLSYNLISTSLDYDPNGSGTQSVTTPGTYGTHLVVTATAPNNGIFLSYVPGTSAPSYDLHLKPITSPAINSGTLPAPNKADGTVRGSNPDEGAYLIDPRMVGFTNDNHVSKYVGKSEIGYRLAS